MFLSHVHVTNADWSWTPVPIYRWIAGVKEAPMCPQLLSGAPALHTHTSPPSPHPPLFHLLKENGNNPCSSFSKGTSSFQLLIVKKKCPQDTANYLKLNMTFWIPKSRWKLLKEIFKYSCSFYISIGENYFLNSNDKILRTEHYSEQEGWTAPCSIFLHCWTWWMGSECRAHPSFSADIFLFELCATVQLKFL